MKGQFVVAAILPAGEFHHRTLNRKLVGTQSRSGSCGEEKIILHVPRIEIQFLGHPAHSPASILSYDGSYPDIHSRNKYDSSHSWNILPRSTPSVTKQTSSVHAHTGNIRADR